MNLSFSLPPNCGICTAPATGENPLIPLHNGKHPFHSVCSSIWVGIYQGCPTCRSPIEPLSLGPHPTLDDRVASSANPILWQEHPLIAAARDGDVKNLKIQLDEPNHAPRILSAAIKTALENGHARALIKALPPNSTYRALATGFAYPATLESHDFESKEVRTQGLRIAALHGIRSSTLGLIRLNYFVEDCANALAFAAPEHPEITQTILDLTPSTMKRTVLQTAIRIAIQEQRYEALLSLAESATLRYYAIQIAVGLRSEPALSILCRSSFIDQALALAYSASDPSSLTYALLREATPKLRMSAISFAIALEPDQWDTSSQFLIENNADRAAAIHFALPNYPDIAKSVYASAENKKDLLKQIQNTYPNINLSNLSANLDQ